MRGRNVFGFNKEIKEVYVWSVRLSTVQLPHKISNYIEVYLMVPNYLMIWLSLNNPNTEILSHFKIEQTTAHIRVSFGVGSTVYNWSGPPCNITSSTMSRAHAMDYTILHWGQAQLGT